MYNLEIYKEKTERINNKVQFLKNYKDENDICKEGIKYILADIISEANSILAHIRHEERRRKND